MLEFLQHPILGPLCIGVLGLCVGSFLNVVILRMHQMMQREWTSQCRALLELETPEQSESSNKFNLNFPASHCPSCQHPLRAWHNIPLISYLFLRGKCSFCKISISWRYPAVELFTALVSAYMAIHFGFTWQLAGALFVLWCLIALTAIDFDHQLLPDDITLLLLWAGLFANLFSIFTSIEAAVIGAMAGYGGFWIIYQVHHRITGKEGMGYGDFKLLAALGAWLGWEMIPMIILAASLSGTLVAVFLMVRKKMGRENPISFGPYLAMGGLLALLWGEQITTGYLHLLNL